MIRDLHGFSEELVELYRKVFPEQNASAQKEMLAEIKELILSRLN